MITTYAYITCKGERKHNEDGIKIKKVDDAHYLFALADGLGGHGRGEVASKLAVEESAAVFSQLYREEECMAQCFLFSQEAILQEQKVRHASDEMKSTLVLLSISGNTVQRGYIGDSRLYYFQKHKLVERTKDHSVPQMLAAMGEIKEEDIRGHADRNRLLRVMGIEWDKPQFVLEPPLKLKEGQTFLLCSDGFWEWIDEQQMISCLKKTANVKEWLAQMENIVLEKGRNKGMDNYSAIGIMVRPDPGRKRLWQF